MYYFYWIPIGTEARVPRTPWATLTLIGLSTVSYLFFQFVPGTVPLFLTLGFKSAEPTLLSLLASLFLHAGLLHLLGNMVYLGVLGPPLETRMGSSRYLIAYLGCGGLGNLCQAAWVLHHDPTLALVPIVGASSAISGLMGLFLVRLYFVRLRFASVTMLLLQGVVRPVRFTLPAVVAVGLWFVLEFIYLLADQISGVAYMSHVSALVFGAGLGFLMGLHGEGRLERLVVRGHRYAERAEWFAALGEYDAYLRQRPEDPDVLLDGARVHRVTHQESQALERFRGAVRLYLKDGNVRAASDAYDEMRRLLGDASLLAPDLLRLAKGLEEAGRPSDASRAYEAYGRQYADRPGAAAALLKSAAIEQSLLNNPGRARFLYQELLSRVLPADLEAIARARADEAERALARQRGAAA